LTAQAQADGRLPQGVTIKEIMDTWTLQKGYPLINVGHNGNTVTISQKEYKPDNQTRIYFVPVAISTQSSPNIDNTLPQYWLYQEPNGLNINFNSTDWIAVNSGGTGKKDSNTMVLLIVGRTSFHSMLFCSYRVLSCGI
jgi:aminopeptidase N